MKASNYAMCFYSFLKENQPLLSLHGHIHESPEVSGGWYTSIGNTICIQPGQSVHYENTLNYALIDLEFMKFERQIVKK
jgi:Icc-related predicted phosphoesterase